MNNDIILYIAGITFAAGMLFMGIVVSTFNTTPISNNILDEYCVYQNGYGSHYIDNNYLGVDTNVTCSLSGCECCGDLCQGIDCDWDNRYWINSNECRP